MLWRYAKVRPRSENEVINCLAAPYEEFHHFYFYVFFTKLPFWRFLETVLTEYW